MSSDDVVAAEDVHHSRYILHSTNNASGTLAIRDVQTLPELLEWQAKRVGSSTLFSFRCRPHSDLITLSYAEAYRKSCALAISLKQRIGFSNTENTVVGVWLERSIDLHLAVLASTISGAAWLPFDADAPTARVTASLQDSRAKILLCDDTHREAAFVAVKEAPCCQVVTFKQLSAQASPSLDAECHVPKPRSQDTAYIIYTSGSSGTPKGIAVSHGAALTFCLSELSILRISPHDVVWQGFSAAFDMFIEETWTSIAGGAHVAIGSRSECQDVPGLGSANGVWAQRGVTIVNAVPTLINIMTSLDEDSRLPPLVRILNLGGEACPSVLVDRLWSPGLQIFNTYGPSETTVTATFKELFPEQPVTIGRPLPNYHALLLPVSDEVPEMWKPLEIREGAEGELAIGGPCLSKGYLGRPDLTTEKFISHPLPSYVGELLYRTGDRVRLDSALDIVFLGRIDAQVKHRGFRIELGEIEHALSMHPNVQTTAVILSSATNRLEAYMVMKQGRHVEIGEIRDTVHKLPAYMQPESWFFLSATEMPRLPSGKINSKALQEISAKRASEESSDIEEHKDNCTKAFWDDGSDLSLLLNTMAAIFPQAKNLTAKSDLFDDLGCHSLFAASLVSKLRRECPEGSIFKRLGLKHIYVHRTAERIVASMSDQVLDEKGSDISKDEVKTSKEHIFDHWPVSRQRYIICGLAQLPALALLFFIEGLSLLGPYIVFYVLLGIYDIGIAILATYFTFVLIPVLKTITAITGKWVVLGKAKAGEYPLYGLYYYRWWLAGQFIKLVDMVTIANTPMLPAIMRCLGARIGKGCTMGKIHVGAAMDLVFIGDDVCLGKDIVLNTSWIERGRIILAEVRIESQTHLGNHSVLEGGVVIGEGSEVGPLSMIPQGMRIMMGERWAGSPARFQDKIDDLGAIRASRPSDLRVAIMTLAVAISSVFVLPILLFGPQIPSMMLFDYIHIQSVSEWTQTAIVAIPAVIIYIFLVYLELLVLRWLVLGKVVERSYSTTSAYFFRKWLVARLMDMSLVILQPVYATLYAVPFLRSLGVKIGHRAEVSTVRGINFELTEIGDESFIADRVLMGNETCHNHTVTLKKTVLKERAFVGNAALVHQGSEMASNTLLGVLSCSPDVPLLEGQSCFGTPPVLMPARQQPRVAYAEHLLFKPRRSQVALRLFIEGARILLPRFVITCGLGFGMLILSYIQDYLGTVASVLMMPLIYFFVFGIPSFITTIFFKWILIGRYKEAEWPLWSVEVWKSEFVTSIFETLTAPLLLEMLTGTPYLAFFLRLLGVQIGSRTTLLSHDVTEFDMVSFGDEAVLNAHALAQTHLFEDRVMKVGRVDIEAKACCQSYSICLPNSRVAEGGQLGSLSLLMKGETVPANEAWEGAPIAPRQEKVLGTLPVLEV